MGSDRAGDLVCLRSGGRRMKITFALDYVAHGNSRAALDICRRLARSGHSVDVVAAGPRNFPVEDPAYRGIRFHVLGKAGRRHVPRFVRNMRATVESTVRQGTEVLCVFQPLAGWGTLRAAIPSVYFFLSAWKLEWETAAQDEHGRLPLKKKLLGFAASGLRNHIEDRVVRAARQVITISRASRAWLESCHPGLERVEIISPGVDVERFAPVASPEEARRRLGLAPSDFLILSVRRLVPRMGLDALIGAMERVGREIPNARLVIGGEGPERTALEALARSLPPGRVQFWGQVREEDLPGLYRAADVVVLPSRALEGFGLVAAEAMACGTPAMGTPVGALPELLEPMGKEFLFEGADATALADGLVAFYRNGGATPELRERCREYIRRHHDGSTQFERVERILVRVAQEGRT